MIAVSGASGFLGSYVVCVLLEKGAQVRAFRRKHSGLSEFEFIFRTYFSQVDEAQQATLKNKLQWVEADVLDMPSIEEALQGVNEVYHCAATVSFLPGDRDLLMRVNAMGTANMVNASLLHGVQKFCHVSSIAALGRERPGAQITENTKWSDSKNNSNYAVSKHKAEMEVWRGMEEGLNAVIVNPGVILGTGDWNKGSCKLFKMVWKGMPFYSYGVNGYVDVKDVARAMVMLMDRNIMHERFILVGENVQMKAFFDQVAECMGKKKPSIHVGKALARIGWRLDALRGFLRGKEPVVTRETANTSQNAYYYSSRKLTEVTGFHFTPMEETIRETCARFLQDQKTINN